MATLQLPSASSAGAMGVLGDDLVNASTTSAAPETQPASAPALLALEASSLRIFRQICPSVVNVSHSRWA